MTSEVDRLITTGPFAHAPQNIEEVRYPSTGDVERSFTIIIAEHAIEDPADQTRRGIAILDNDNATIIFDGLCSGICPKGPALTIRLAAIASMNWREFSRMCRENPRYRDGTRDIDEPVDEPENGNLTRQAALGLNISPSSDARSNFVREISADRHVPYKFPPINRAGMTAEICRHKMFQQAPHCSAHLAWDIQFPKRWNRTGRIEGLRKMDSAEDSNWRHMVDSNPEITRRAQMNVIEPFTLIPTCILDMTAYPCEFERVGENGADLILKKFAGRFMPSTRDIDMPTRLKRMNDASVEALWVVCRVLDADLSPASMVSQAEFEMHNLRCAYEDGNLDAFIA